ncbi:MAG TPA: phage holin family protein [Dongiaceae bacterium]|jgi:hypothetical protein
MLPLLRTLFLTAAVRTGTGEAKRRMQRAVARGAIVAAGGILAFGGLLFFIIAGHDAIADRLDPLSAKLICGGALVVLGLILFLIGRQPRRLTPPLPEQSAPEAVGDAAAAIGRNLEAALARNAGTLTLGAFVLGLLMASRRK